MSADDVNGLPGACVTSIAGSGTSFTYDPQCGDDILIHYLAAGSISIESIRPNPAKNALEIRIASPDTVFHEIAVTAFDLLGRQIALEPSADMTYDVSALPEGVYYIEVRSGAARAVRELVIER
jgi:hypothetical protein